MKNNQSTFFIKTFGCQMNFSDSERMVTFLESNKFTLSPSWNRADLVIFNTCGVRQTAEDRVYGQIHNLRKKNKDAFVIVTGCVAHRKDLQKKLKNKTDLFITTSDFFKLEVENLKLRENSSIKKQACDYLKIVPRYKNKEEILVPIMTGCNNFCSYCVVPYARGREWSRPIDDIAKEIDLAFQNGTRQVMLLGQNVNSYEFVAEDKNSQKITFPILLDFLADSYPKITWRFLTSHPKDFSGELIKVITKHKNIPNEIHLPIQSGSDKVLKSMNRPYTQAHYLKLIDKIRIKIPSVKITTDVIVGFPAETEKEFQKTVKVFKKVKFDNAYINKYSPRSETAAEKLGNPIPWDEKKKREKILRKLIMH